MFKDRKQELISKNRSANKTIDDKSRTQEKSIVYFYFFLKLLVFNSLDYI